ncbi:(Fe-S)-binding protein [Halarsenatibacter silvermanii]|uniref:Metal-binding trascriptional regulator, contains putative Fe-S cluster and ArsR family DNA binding domain n=1 Tax=Halarsenatibacter silvermanii TaxID=321763 RepID=A0A1G9IVK4_9FIRM|nr:(Fe-S)-binding protein [Halarsenatibacter silvermanii]SDL29142.1 Metal-binding trascriptional regulator, contains putative Fe-S cluster and ArsR family DNA binding domain [Halarsenatibacter silvermanii]
MTLNRVDITYISPCLADPDKIRLKADLGSNIGDIFPFVNAEIERANYNPGLPSLSLQKEFRTITLYEEKMTMIKAENSTDAMQVIEWLKDIINDIYARKDEIEPDHTASDPPRPLEIFKLLPKTNCSKCGELTCLAFAVQLLEYEQDLENCPKLKEKDYADARETLKAMLPQ